MPDSSPRLIAYLDEAGCAGSKYGTGSSQFLVIGGIVLSAEQETDALDIFTSARRERNSSKQFRKFSEANDKDNFVLTKLLSSKAVRIVQVALHKPSMEGKFTRDNHQEEYHYLSKFAIERISWIARESARKHPDLETKCKIIFSEQKLYPYNDMQEYLDKLRYDNGYYNCRIAWDFISQGIEAQPHKNETGTHLADIVASSLHKAIEPKQYGMTDDRYQINLSSIVARFNGKPHGLKLFPPQEISKMIDEGRFSFLKTML